MTGVGVRQYLFIFCGLAAVTAVGCADMDIFPSWMPFQGKISDDLPGVVTPAQRMAELRKLSDEAGGKSVEEKQRISQQLVDAIRKEKDPLIRTEIIRVLGKYPGPDADAVLKAALNDADIHVRVAACEALGKRSDEQTAKLLSEVLRSDVDADVRLAAAKALGEGKNPAAVAALGEALSDGDPAMQYRAVLSLKQVTGKDLGDNLERWQQYVKGETPAPAPSLAEKFRQWF
jgi:HEAT repeat protein